MSDTATTTAIWPGRIAQAVKAASLKKNAGQPIVLTTCPKPKTATGTAHRVRGMGIVPDGYHVTSKGADVVLTRADDGRYRPLPGAGVSDPAKRKAMGLGPVQVKSAAADPGAKERNAQNAKARKSTKKVQKPAAARPRVRRRVKATA